MSPHRRFICLQVAAKGSPHFAAGRHGMAGTALVCVDDIGKLRSATVRPIVSSFVSQDCTSTHEFEIERHDRSIGRGRISKIAFGLIISNLFEP